MSKKYQASLQADCRHLDKDIRKIVFDALRSGIKNEHGYLATKGLTDTKLQTWPVVIRFSALRTRESFKIKLKKALHPNVVQALALKDLCPSDSVYKPFRLVSNA